MSNHGNLLNEPGGFVIGIDLGSYKTCVGVFRSGRVEIIPDNGQNAIPSYVAFTDHTWLVGEAAKAQIISNTSNTITDPGRFLGNSKGISYAVEQSKLFRSLTPIVSAQNESLFKVRYKNQDLCLKPEEALAMILSRAKDLAEDHLRGKGAVLGAVITISAGRNLLQRELMRTAASIAGLKICLMLSDSTASIITHEYLNGKVCGDMRVMAINIGSWKTDVTLTIVEDGVIEVLAVADDPESGSNSFLARLVDYVVHSTPHLKALNLEESPDILRRLQRACELVLHDLSFCDSTTIHITSLFDGYDLDVSVAREDFEGFCSDLLETIINQVQRALADSRIDKLQVDEVLLAGGGCRIPMIQNAISDFFYGRHVSKLPNVDEAAAYGASLYASLYSQNQEARCRRMDELLLLDVMPPSLSISIQENELERVIRRNTTIPTRKSDIFHTVEDDQTSFTIAVYEGERQRAKDNLLLGTFSFPIAPKPKCKVHIWITFDIDIRHNLVVTAQGQPQGIVHTLQPIWKRHTSKEEIAISVEKLKQLKADDILERERLHARNELEQYIQSATKSLQGTEDGNFLDAAKQFIDRTAKWMEENDAETTQYQTRKEEMLSFLKSRGAIVL
ncbi:hypothetical protein EG329_002923 [Mollisiaceae sp. DMI_Dod_QoI]|nr:hypothetical protein EG329_002923 [Helotiales sp. DMI_Dod_QoI]